MPTLTGSRSINKSCISSAEHACYYFLLLIAAMGEKEYEPTRNDRLVMIVSSDKYELPLYVADKSSEVANLLGMSPSGVSNLITYNNRCRLTYLGEQVKVKLVTDVNKDMD